MPTDGTEGPEPARATVGSSSVVETVEPDGVEGVRLFEVVDQLGAPVPGPRLALVAVTHGNETVGDLVLERLLPMLPDELVCGSLLVVRSNLRAAAVGRRHTPEGTDINRLWDAYTLGRIASMSAEERAYEHERVLALAPLLEGTDGILDLHSASQPSPPFLVVRDDQRHAQLVESLGVRRVVTGLHEDGVLGGGVTPDVGLLLGEGSRRVGITFEAGQHSDPDNRRRAFEVVVRFLAAMGVWRTTPPPVTVRPQVFEVVDAFRQAPAGSEPFEFPGYVDGSHTLTSGRPLASFQPVAAGEVLLRRGDHTVVRAPSPFTIVLPTPTADPGTDMYYVALERRGGPDPAVGRTHDEARREAAAIESMLDVLADDELAAGSTWASFHGRQVMDLAADVVMRTLRLPADHPHRRLSLIGRGEWGGDAGTAREGRRYRRAFRRAIADGVPIDRYQLLRGASLSWLDALTSSGMAELLRRRREVRRMRRQRGTGIRMYLSAERPSAVAMLVAGDLDRARSTGDLRHVRVVVIIEAPVVEADGDEARVRALRFGLVSARRPFLDLAHTLIQRLRAEHAALVRQPPLSDAEAVHDALGPGDALVPPGDAPHLQALGRALTDLQLRLWRDALRHVVTEETLAPGTRGVWLARLMRGSGVLDAAGLQGLLLDGRTVRPERLLAPPDTLVGRPRGVRPARIRPPIAADEVDADTLARWVGWRRTLGSRQVIPDTRGMDVDLIFHEEPIADRLSGWLARATEDAAASPGHVLVCMVGDGLRPGERRSRTGLVRDHVRMLLDPNVRYLRVQHARGSYLRWLKGLVSTLARRPDGAAPATIRFEGETGTSINLTLVARWEGEGEPPASTSTLDGWAITACAALVSSLGQRGASRVGVFAESEGERAANPELLQFARAHVEGLLEQEGSPTVDSDAELAEHLFVERVATWIKRARDLRDAPFPVPESPTERAKWLQTRLGLADPSLVRALVKEMDRDTPPRPTARALWDVVVPWPEI